MQSWPVTVETKDERDGQRENEYMEFIRKEVCDLMNILMYDHRHEMPEEVGRRFPHMLHDHQLRYARCKAAVARALKPRTIYEVGVGWGVSARAFIAGYPDTKFFGIDSGEMGLNPAVVMAGTPQAEVATIASDDLPRFIHPDGAIDLLHVDGGHGYEQKIHDMIKAIEAKPEWILVDDVHNKMVARGTFEGLWRAAPVAISMVYFENSHTSSLLIHHKRQEPDYRKP